MFVVTGMALFDHPAIAQDYCNINEPLSNLWQGNGLVPSSPQPLTNNVTNLPALMTEVMGIWDAAIPYKAPFSYDSLSYNPNSNQSITYALCYPAAGCNYNLVMLYPACPSYFDWASDSGCYMRHSDGILYPVVEIHPSNLSYTYIDWYGTVCGRNGKALGAPSCNSGEVMVGNPVNAGTANKFHRELLYVSSNSNSGVHFSLSYNSLLPVAGAVGYGWRHSYQKWVDKGVYQSGITNVDGMAIFRTDGKAYRFNPVSGAWVPDADVNYSLSQITNAQGGTLGWQLLDPDHTVETYGADNKLTSIATPAGMAQTMLYADGTGGINGGYVLDATGNPTTATLAAGTLIRVSDTTGRSISFGYNSSGRLVKLTDPEGQAYLFAYTSDDNLSSITFPDGKKKQYLYGETAYTSGASLPHALTGIIDENGVRFATYRYDATGRAYDEDHGGPVDHYNLAYTTDTSGNPITTVTDPLGTPRTYNFTTVLSVVKSTGVGQPGGSGCGAAASNVTYDANGNIASRTDFNGNKSTYIYDLSRNLETSRTEASGSAVAKTIATTWHPTFRLPTQISEPGRVTNMSYDATTGNLLTKSITDTLSNTTRTWTYTYTTAADNTLAALLKTVDGPRTDVADITSYTYNPNGDLASVTNALGQVTSLTSYDPNGRPLTIVDPNGLTTTLAYTPRGWLSSRTVGVETTSYVYDGVGQLTQVSLPDSSSITYTYDAAHRLTDITDTLGNRIHYTLDNIGNRVQEKVYDSLNNLSTTKSRAFDALNRLWKEIGALNQTTLYTYDTNGNLTSITDPLAHTTVNAYDALNRLSQVTDAASGITRYSYDPLDQLTSVTDPRNLTTSYTVNALGDQKVLTSPDTGTTNKTYDAAGNLKTSTDARGVVSSYTYDGLNRLTGISFTSGLPIAYQYDTGANAIGHVTQMTDEAGATTWTYNTQGRVASKTQVVSGITSKVAFGYDTAGRLKQITYPSGAVVSYGFDGKGQISSINVNGQALLTNILYQPFGPAKGWTWGNGSTYARAFDQDGRVSSYPLSTGLRALTYDAGSRITGITDSQPAANQLLSYDSLDRLTSWIASSTNQSYGYDTNGNRTSLVIGANPYVYTYPTTSNRLTSVTGPTAKTYTYDASGNLTADGSTAYTYNAPGRMVSVTSGRTTTSYMLNGLGQRVNKGAGVNSNRFVHAGPGVNSTGFVYDEFGHLIGEYDRNGVSIEETVYLGDMPVAVLVGTSTYYIQSDHLNAPRVISDVTNALVWRWDQSDPFGTTPPNENPSGLGTFNYNLRFPGQYYDQETGLHYNYFRDYDPSTGRYVQSDLLGLFGGSLSTYGYANQNPLSFSDPFGLEAIIVLTPAGPMPVPVLPPVTNSTQAPKSNDPYAQIFNPPLPQPIDPWTQTTPIVQVPAPIPVDPRNCQKQYTEDLERCDTMTETSCHFGIDFDKLACRIKAYTRYRACRRINNPAGNNWTHFDD